MNTPPTAPTAFRASILHFLADPGADETAPAAQFFEDGLLIVENGKVTSVGSAHDLLPVLPVRARIIDRSGKMIIPGFVDAHIHYPQLDIIAAPGRQLLDWLEHYTFPVERRFGDAAYAREVADFFLDELLRNGTTTALVFGTVHKQSVDAFFDAATAKDLRMIAGKVLMDRNCPDYLRDTPESGYRDSAELIGKWHGRDRLEYAITPRFAVTSSEQQLALAGKLAAEHPTTRIHTHVAENAAAQTGQKARSAAAGSASAGSTMRSAWQAVTRCSAVKLMPARYSSIEALHSASSADGTSLAAT